MATQTPNYSFDVPEVGADTDQWGGFLNANWTEVDTVLKSVQDQVNDLDSTLTDAIAALAAQALIPVGGLYTSAADTDPATTLGYGTWAEYAAGRALVGVGNNGESGWLTGDTRGSETHSLTEGELPSHTHAITDPGHGHDVTDPGHDHEYFRTFGGTGSTNQGSSNASAQRTSTEVTGITIANAQTGVTVAAAGSNESHNNIQPSIGIYVWRRTA